MAFEIPSWNINPNRLWFVRLSDAGTGIRVELYLTEEDAEAQIARQAFGTTSGYGAALPLMLEQDPGAQVAIATFQPTLPWHVQVSGAAMDPARILRKRPCVELPPIDHPIYRNEDIIITRATAEVDAHTHAVLRKEISLGSHLPTLEPGHVVRLNSMRRGRDELLQVLEHKISVQVSDGGEMSLTSSIITAGYLAVKQ